MLLLTSISDKLQVVTSSAATVDVHASFMDYDGAVVTPGRQDTAIAAATTTDIVPAPGASVKRNVKTLHIRNRHGSTSVDVTIKHTDGSTPVELHKETLLAGEDLQYTDALGFLKL